MPILIASGGLVVLLLTKIDPLWVSSPPVAQDSCRSCSDLASHRRISLTDS